MKKVSVLMAFLVAGYVLGIWNFLVLSKYYLVFGMKGFLISLVPALAALYLMYSEAETTKKTRYLIYEMFFKVTKTPALVFTLLMFLIIMLGVTTYFTAYSLPFVFGMQPTAVNMVAFVFITVLVAVLLLILAKGRTLEFIAGISILMILFTIISTLLIRNKALSVVTSEEAKYYMTHALSSITSFHQPLSFEGIAMLLISVIIAFGLGAGVYYVIGSFAPEGLDFKRVLAGVFILQIILSFAAAYTIAYSLGASYQALQDTANNLTATSSQSLFFFDKFTQIKTYVTNSRQSPMSSIGVFYTIPSVLKGKVPGSSEIIFLLMMALYFAGITTMIVLIEMGAQMFLEVMQVNRTKALLAISAMGFVIGAAMIVSSVKVLFLAVPFSVGALVAAAELYPTRSKEFGTNKGLSTVIMVFLIGLGLMTIYYAFKSFGDMGRLGAILGLVLFVPLVMNNMLLGARR